jgi:hypothetical protein
MTALPFPSGVRVDTAAMPAIASGRTTLANGSEGAQLQPELAQPLRPTEGMRRMSSPALFQLADELGALVAYEKDSGEPWIEYAALVERQAVAELARRAI